MHYHCFMQNVMISIENVSLPAILAFKIYTDRSERTQESLSMNTLKLNDISFDNTTSDIMYPPIHTNSCSVPIYVFEQNTGFIYVLDYSF